MWRHLAANGLSLLVVVLAVCAAIIGWGKVQYEQAGPLQQAICLRVESGSNMRRVSDELAERGAVSRPEVFRLGTQYTERADQLKAGSFLIEEGSSMREIVQTITGDGQSTCGTEILYRIGVTSQDIRVRELDPASNQFDVVAEFDPKVDAAPELYRQLRGEADTRYRIAIAEGVTSWQVVEALKAADFLAGTVEAVPPEGLLAPDSYEVRLDTSRADLIQQMRDRQAERINASWQQRADQLPFDTPEEALIMASIIEKETGLPNERRQVASVFINRLEQGMRLQTDPTVIYGITNGQGTLDRGLRRSELDAATPYNTYQIDGLPPTPIANPGLASIEAAVDPDRTDYLFFVADGTGGHAFARTLSEHNDNVARWRQIEAERQSDGGTSN